MHVLTASLPHARNSENNKQVSCLQQMLLLMPLQVKKKKRDEWEEGNPRLEKVIEDAFKVICKACSKISSISHGGVTDIKQHASGELHLRNIRSQGSVAQFFIPNRSLKLDFVSYPLKCIKILRCEDSNYTYMYSDPQLIHN